MALVQYGGGITRMSGSIAGNTFAKNRYGSYVRARMKPVNPKSDRQNAIRTILSFLAEYWHADLDNTERGLWNTYAAAVAMKNKLGDTIKLTGFNHFMRTNAARLTTGFGDVSAAPAIGSLPEKDHTLVCVEDNVTAQTFKFVCSTDGWTANGDPKLRILLYQGRPQLASRYFFAGPWRFMAVITPTEGQAGTKSPIAAFTFALGQKVWFQARVLTESGRLSKLWTLDPRIVKDDAP